MAEDLVVTVPAPRHAGDRDGLTHLGGRGALLAALGAATGRNVGGPGPVLLVLDLDRFQSVNDSAGIAAGDTVLGRVAGRILRVVPPTATVARISGDEFGVLLPDGRGVEPVVMRLLDLLSRPFVVTGDAVTLSVSIGSARAPDDGADPEELLRSATLALHHAEASGRNRWSRFDPSMRLRARDRLDLESALRASLALNRDELSRTMATERFAVHYQPQVAAADGRLTGFEALMRWQHPDRGPVPPGVFIPLAEEIGLIGLLGQWVLRTACRAAPAWPLSTSPTAPPLTVAVNVSPIQLREGRAFVAGVAAALEESGLPPACLELEITETALLGDARETLRALKALGVSLALDDFGTGYSSLSELAHYPFDRLKIDRSFVRALAERGASPGTPDGHARWMIQAIASLGAGLGMSTIAEGVETAAQAVMVRDAGVSGLQGFLVSPAVVEDEVPALARRLSRPPPPTDPEEHP